MNPRPGSARYLDEVRLSRRGEALGSPRSTDRRDARTVSALLFDAVLTALQAAAETGGHVVPTVGRSLRGIAHARRRPPRRRHRLRVALPVAVVVPALVSLALLTAVWVALHA